MMRLRFIDCATLVYLALVALLLIVRRQSASPYWPAWLTLHALLAGGIILMARSRLRGAMQWLRELYPIPLFLLFYRESESLNHAIVSQPLDPWFLSFEARWFGFSPSLTFAHRFPSTAFAEILYAAYFAFYPMILGIVWWSVTGDRAAGRRFLGNLAVVFYMCYGLFILIPVVGPRIIDLGSAPPQVLDPIGLLNVGPMPASSQAGPFARLMSLVYRWFEGEGGAFPSSHVIVSCIILRESFRQRFRIRWILAVIVGLLCVATVYGRYHHVSDVVAGLVLALPLATAAEWWQGRFEKSGGNGQMGRS